MKPAEEWAKDIEVQVQGSGAIWGYDMPAYVALARAIQADALRAAEKLAEDYAADCYSRLTYPKTSYAEGKSDGASYVASRIRALIPQETQEDGG